MTNTCLLCAIDHPHKHIEEGDLIGYLTDSVKEYEEVYTGLAEYELNKSTGNVQRKE